MGRKKINPIFYALILMIAEALGNKLSLPTQLLQLTNGSVFDAFEKFEVQYKPIPLGAGYPDFNPPDKLRNALVTATWGNYTMSQYVEASGDPELLDRLAKFHSKLLNRNLSSDNFIVTAGATEALYLTYYTFTEPGDEWIIFDPFFENYAFDARASKGVAKYVPLRVAKGKSGNRASDYTFDRNELKRAFSSKTRGVVINTPHNPLGKIFTNEELQFIADLCKMHNVLVVVDEVYQFLVFDDNTYTRMINLPGMFDRTITIGSGGKMFSATGYRIGWAYGPKAIIDLLRTVHPLLVRSLPRNIQVAYAVTIEDERRLYGDPRSYISHLKALAQNNRNFLIDLFESVDIRPVVPDGGYFMVANFTNYVPESVYMNEEGERKDYKFCKWLMEKVNVGCLPLSGFYAQQHKKLGEDYIRITLIKSKETLLRSQQNLQTWKSRDYA